ncbi:glycoside hydrolase superfamily [Suillus discolor]|uniref:beta-glucosidase n=1 Tax=Suillus discolor TaxID=1912936 RepID=A0A9P7EVY8_9AGAM|nr:glycoside hydrolase superfamily [Suillus discolor]KAG2091222.1 glycoside hydrolase superfamily [Suillus discolor]
MPWSDFANADVDDIVEKLTTDEAILLTAGVGFWHTHEIARLGIPAIKVSNGIRGNHFFMSTLAKCLPSSTALGATWDTELIEEVRLKLLASEAKLRAVPVILALACNVQRNRLQNPLGGHAFESLSEDPLLSGLIAAAYVKGVQKWRHWNYNQAFRKYAKPWCFMTSYNHVNGTHTSENKHLLQDILRREWGFEGLVMSDCIPVLKANQGEDVPTGHVSGLFRIKFESMPQHRMMAHLVLHEFLEVHPAYALSIDTRIHAREISISSPVTADPQQRLDEYWPVTGVKWVTHAIVGDCGK